jgi:mannitol 2-dehydrogenase
VSVALCQVNLAQLPAGVERPSYDRGALRPGILHIGVGNFHRAHQAVYLDDLFNRGRGLDWGIVGAGLRETDARMRARLAPQDWLNAVVEVEDGKMSGRVTGAMVDFLPVSEDNRALLQKLADPEIRIVSMTITEGGYCIDPKSGEFNPRGPGILANAAQTGSPRGVFGCLVTALAARKTASIPPFTVMSCDNIPNNGDVARNAVLGYAGLIDAGLAAWIGDHVAFPNSMVDRVTPVQAAHHQLLVKELLGIDDAAPVICEPYRQWVIEDRFASGRPALEEVGVIFTDQVAAFELMKLRILNGGHALIAYPAALLGMTFVHEAMAHPLIRGFLQKVVKDEVIPHVPPPPDIDLADYLESVMQRFANPQIGDTIARLCQDGSNRQPKFILPSTRDGRVWGTPIQGLALVSALWCRYCYGESEKGRPIAVEDDEAGTLIPAARKAREEPLAFLASTDAFGDLADDRTFQNAFAVALSSLWAKGVARTLSGFIDATEA